MHTVSDLMLRDQIREEVQRITMVIEALTGLKTNWNGEFEFAPTQARFKGLKPFGCSILLREDLARNDIRWRTLIHEAFHAVSAGYNQIDFDQNVGYEEGVVEQLQRLFRPRILAQLEVTVPESVFAEEDARHPFNLYIDQLRSIQQALGIMEETFYVDLIATPIKERHSHLFNQAMGNKNRTALMALSVARPILESTHYADLTDRS